MQAGVPLDAAQRRHPDRSVLADAPQVVPGQVDDHDVLCPVLPAGGEHVSVDRGALDRPGLDVVPPTGEETLGGGGDHGPGAQAYEGGVRGGVEAHEAGEEADRIGPERAGEPPGEVDLVALARLDETDHRANACFELLPGDVRPPWPEPWAA